MAATQVKITFGAEDQWEQRAGRKAIPVPDHIIAAVNKSYETSKVASVTIADEAERKSLVHLLRKAGRQLGKTVSVQVKDDGTVLFRVTDKVARPRKAKPVTNASEAAA